jgi:hypothetical protein
MWPGLQKFTFAAQGKKVQINFHACMVGELFCKRPMFVVKFGNSECSVPYLIVPPLCSCPSDAPALVPPLYSCPSDAPALLFSLTLTNWEFQNSA